MRKYSLIIIAALVVVFFDACCPPETKNTNVFRIIHNNDGTDLFGNHWFNSRPLTFADLDECVSMIAGTQVTTFMMCSGSELLYYRSAYEKLFGDDLNGTVNCGEDTKDYEDARNYYRNQMFLEKEGTDIIAATLGMAKEKGMETFITYRMNDLHFADTATVCPIWYAGSFWRAHPEYWTNDSTQGWHSAGALDFSHKEVRDRKLAIISEQLDKYDMIDGFDLDFMRFIVYFKDGEGEKKENTEAMTQLVKDINARTPTHAERLRLYK